MAWKLKRVKNVIVTELTPALSDKQFKTLVAILDLRWGRVAAQNQRV